MKVDRSGSRPKKPLGERSSASELWAEVQRLQAEGARQGPVTESEALKEARLEIHRTRARETEARRELAAARADASLGIVGEAFAGSKALANFRRFSVSKFTSALLALPAQFRRHGLQAAEEDVTTKLIPDLLLLKAAIDPGERTDALTRDQDRTMKRFTDPGKRRILVRPESWADGYRLETLRAVHRAFIGPSMQKMYSRGREEIKNRWGAVDK